MCRSLHQLEAVVLESLRLLPPAYLVGRCTTQSLQLGGYIIPKGKQLKLVCLSQKPYFGAEALSASFMSAHA